MSLTLIQQPALGNAMLARLSFGVIGFAKKPLVSGLEFEVLRLDSSLLCPFDFA